MLLTEQAFSSNSASCHPHISNLQSSNTKLSRLDDSSIVPIARRHSKGNERD